MKCQRVLSSRKQASRYIFATHTDVKSIPRINFRVTVLSQDFHGRSYQLVFITGYRSLIEELQKQRLMNTLSSHSCETYKQCVRYVFTGFFFAHLTSRPSRHSYLVYCQRDSHATSQTAIYANITQTGRMKVYFTWFWIVLAGFVGGCRWFWLVPCFCN